MVSIAQIHKLTSVVYSVVFNLMGCKISDTKLMYKLTKLLKRMVYNKSWQLNLPFLFLCCVCHASFDVVCDVSEYGMWYDRVCEFVC